MPTRYEQDYCDLINRILTNGNKRNTRAAPAISVFGEVLEVHDLVHGNFPILNGRKIYYKGVMGELAAFLKGPKHLVDFEKEGCNYWEPWADVDGHINVDYGNAWIDWNGVNQLDNLLSSLATDPMGRRHIISGWRPDHLDSLSLPCCHLLYQWYVNGDELEMIWYQRSVDTMVGLPSDIILAACWNILIAEELGLNPGKLIFMLGDTHIYQQHMPSVLQYLKSAKHSTNREIGYFNEAKLSTFDNKSISLIEYEPNPPINFKVFT